MSLTNSEFYKEAINDELEFIMSSYTWLLTVLPKGCKPLSSKWVFKKKLKVDESIDKFKARVIVRRNDQKKNINYFDTY